MAHFAELDETNLVIQVVVVRNEDMLDENGVEQEQLGIDYLNNLFGEKRWVQTSYNNNFRKNYASVGSFYDPIKDAFPSAQFYPSWILNQETYKYEAPIPMPNDGKTYYWNEENLSWVEIE